MEEIQQTKTNVFWLLEEITKEQKTASKAPVFKVKVHLERLASLQNRFNANIAKAVFYGK